MVHMCASHDVLDAYFHSVVDALARGRVVGASRTLQSSASGTVVHH
jgi:hypothetical protein